MCTEIIYEILEIVALQCFIYGKTWRACKKGKDTVKISMKKAK